MKQSSIILNSKLMAAGWLLSTDSRAQGCGADKFEMLSKLTRTNGFKP
jgi:hypothetical protein